MTPEQITDLKQEFEETLQKFGFPVRARCAGLPYLFIFDDGSRRYTFSGRIEAIEILDGGVLEVYVTAPHFGLPQRELVNIRFSKDDSRIFADILVEFEDYRSVYGYQHKHIRVEGIFGIYIPGGYTEVHVS